MRVTILLTLSLTVCGCSLLQDMSGYTFATPDAGADATTLDAAPNEADAAELASLDGGDATAPDSALEPLDGSVPPESDASQESQFDSSADDLDASSLDSSLADAGTDSGPIFPHGCIPPTQWCAGKAMCYTNHQLDIYNGYCDNCTRNAQTGTWTCAN